jgi:hypothetical protein
MPYWDLLADAANSADIKKISVYMISPEIGSPTGQSIDVAIHFGANSTLVVKDDAGQEITLKGRDAAEVLLLPMRRGSTNLSAQWTKDRKAFNKGTISGFSGGGFTFALHTDSTGSR